MDWGRGLDWDISLRLGVGEFELESKCLRLDVWILNWDSGALRLGV